MSDAPVTTDRFEAEVLRLLAAAAPGRTISPADVAQSLGGAHPDGWGPLMKPIRAAAVRLARQGLIVIIRKGRVVDPGDFRGVYRLGLPLASQGPGSSASV